jgi:hypothetical protein
MHNGTSVVDVQGRWPKSFVGVITPGACAPPHPTPSMHAPAASLGVHNWPMFVLVTRWRQCVAPKSHATIIARLLPSNLGSEQTIIKFRCFGGFSIRYRPHTHSHWRTLAHAHAINCQASSQRYNVYRSLEAHSTVYSYVLLAKWHVICSKVNASTSIGDRLSCTRASTSQCIQCSERNQECSPVRCSILHLKCHCRSIASRRVVSARGPSAIGSVLMYHFTLMPV